MSKKEYLTSPLATDKMPPSVPAILANETCERFAYYGVRLILTVFLLNHLLNMEHQPAGLSNNSVIKWGSWFNTAVYLLPLLGAIIADAFLGKFRTIIVFSIVYCLGFLAITIDQTYLGTIIGLTLIAFGTGIIKPCVSANVGDQFGQSNKHLITKVYGWFYAAINIGAMVTGISAPILLAKCGPRIAFAVPGVFMVMALAFYWFGRRKLVHAPPAGTGYIKEAFTGEGLRVLLKLSVVFLLVSVFWCLFDQTMTAWVIQAQHMNRVVYDFNIETATGFKQWLADHGLNRLELLPSHLQSFNSFLVVAMIPLFTYIIYPALNKLFNLTSLIKINIGFFITAISFVIAGWIETQIQNGFAPHWIWQVVAYVFITAGEIMVSITVLEFSYTQAPLKMKSLLSSIGLLPIALGSAFTAIVNEIIEKDDGTSMLPGASYYWFFTGCMIAAGLVFILVTIFYKEKTYIQDEAPPESAAENSEQ